MNVAKILLNYCIENRDTEIYSTMKVCFCFFLRGGLKKPGPDVQSLVIQNRKLSEGGHHHTVQGLSKGCLKTFFCLFWPPQEE